MRTGATPDGVATEQSEGALLLELAKDSFRQQIAKRVRTLARSYVEKWLKCELWMYSSGSKGHSKELHSDKADVLHTLRTPSLDEMAAICGTRRPDRVGVRSKRAARAELPTETQKAS